MKKSFFCLSYSCSLRELLFLWSSFSSNPFFLFTSLRPLLCIPTHFDDIFWAFISSLYMCAFYVCQKPFSQIGCGLSAKKKDVCINLPLLLFGNSHVSKKKDQPRISVCFHTARQLCGISRVTSAWLIIAVSSTMPARPFTQSFFHFCYRRSCWLRENISGG